MTNNKSGWHVLGLTVLLAGSLSFIGLAIADEEHEAAQGMPHHSGMMGAPGMKGPGMMSPHMSLSPLGMKEELGLNEEQVKALEPMEADYRKTVIKSRADIRIAMIDLGALLDQKGPDRGAISAKIDEISGLRKQMMMYRVDVLLKMKEILTPDQYGQYRAKVKSQMERGMGRRMHGMGGMMGHGKMADYDKDDEKEKE